MILHRPDADLRESGGVARLDFPPGVAMVALLSVGDVAMLQVYIDFALDLHIDMGYHTAAKEWRRQIKQFWFRYEFVDPSVA